MIYRLLLCGLVWACVTTTAYAQLTPPAGAPAATTKVEARTAIESTPYTISTSGSYYLTKNLTHTNLLADGISITADNVTLDLNGFTLTGPDSGSPNGIAATNKKNIVIKNGTVEKFLMVCIFKEIV